MERADDRIAVDLTDEQLWVLGRGLTDWAGPAFCTEEMAVAMGFASLSDLWNQADRLYAAVRQRQPLSRFDWTRALLATEVLFASEVVGAAGDWSELTGMTPEQGLLILRQLQRLLPFDRSLIGTRP